jgi:hypothetical protein
LFCEIVRIKSIWDREDFSFILVAVIALFCWANRKNSNTYYGPEI